MLIKFLKSRNVCNIESNDNEHFKKYSFSKDIKIKPNCDII